MAISSCQNDERDGSLIPRESLLGSAELEEFADRKPQVSNNGTKLAFLSTRTELTEDTFISKAFLWQEESGLKQIDENIDELREKPQIAFGLKDDGTWMALASVDVAEDNSKSIDLRLVSADFSKVQSIPLAGATWVNEIRFSAAGAAFAISWENDNREYFVTYVVFDNATGAEVGRSNNVAGQTFHLHYKSGDSGAQEYLLAEISNGSELEVQLYTVTGQALVRVGPTGEDNKVAIGFDDQTSFATLTDLGPILYQQFMETESTPVRRKQELGTGQTGETPTLPGFIKLPYQFTTLSYSDPTQVLEGDSSFNDPRITTFEPVVVTEVVANQNFSLMLGSDRYYCSDVARFYLPTLSLINHTTGAVASFAVVMGEGAEGELGSRPATFTADVCAKVAEGGIPTSLFEERITRVSLGVSDGRTFTIAFESWDSIDSEIYMGQVKIEDFRSNDSAKSSFSVAKEIVAVSNNYFRSQ